MRVFAVPRGMPSRRLISSAVHPPKTASTTAARLLVGEEAEAVHHPGGVDVARRRLGGGVGGLPAQRGV